jgi:hypothetical protein
VKEHTRQTGTKGPKGKAGSSLVVMQSAAAAPAPEPKPEKLTKNDIDRKGLLEAILCDYTLQIAPYQAEDKILENKILAACADVAAADIHTDEGERYRLLAGPRAEQQQLVDGALVKILGWLGQDLFLRGASVTFKWLEAVLTPEQYAEVVKKERTGRRSIKIAPKAAPTPLQAA